MQLLPSDQNQISPFKINNFFPKETVTLPKMHTDYNYGTHDVPSITQIEHLKFCVVFQNLSTNLFYLSPGAAWAVVAHALANVEL